MVPGKKMKNEVVRKKGKGKRGKEKGKRKKGKGKREKEKGESDFFLSICGTHFC